MTYAEAIKDILARFHTHGVKPEAIVLTTRQQLYQLRADAPYRDFVEDLGRARIGTEGLRFCGVAIVINPHAATPHVLGNDWRQGEQMTITIPDLSRNPDTSNA